MFMTQFCLAANRQSLVSLVLLRYLRHAAPLLLLLTVSTGCKSEETAFKPSSDPKRPRQVEDAGPQCPIFDARYRSQFKACNEDADCEVAEVEFGCAGKRGVYGVSSAAREDFDECVPQAESLRPCSHPAPTRAEDNRVVRPELSGVEAHCIEGACQTRVGERPCGSGDLICTRSQLCVSFLSTLGVPQFTCVDNPCGADTLDCTCAEPVCVAAGMEQHTCAVDQIEDSDVFCKLERR
jgi:hypothetical protein